MAGAIGEFIFMDDNDRPHRAGIVNEYLENKTIQCTDWPSFLQTLTLLMRGTFFRNTFQLLQHFPKIHIITSKIDLESAFMPTNFKIFIKFIPNVLCSHKDELEGAYCFTPFRL